MSIEQKLREIATAAGAQRAGQLQLEILSFLIDRDGSVIINRADGETFVASPSRNLHGEAGLVSAEALLELLEKHTGAVFRPGRLYLRRSLGKRGLTFVEAGR